MDITTADAPDQGGRSDGSSRRRLLTAGLSGAALAALATRPVSAAAVGEETTTTAPPKRPTSEDTAMLVFAQGAELAALALYEQALAGGASFDETSLATMDSIRRHHDAYAEALGGLLGRDSVTVADQAVLDANTAGFSGSAVADIAAAAHELEKTLVATHTSLMEKLDGVDGAGLIASILVVEARHVPVLASLAGLSPVADIDAFVGENDATALTPADPA